jgi:serine/threonine protein kinase
MSPEQVQGDDRLEATSDVYALGIILFEMLTGQQPFSADTPTKLMMKHVLDPVPRIRDVDPRLPAGADEVIAKALAKDRQMRYSSAGALAEAARELLGADRRVMASPERTPLHAAGSRPRRKQLSRTLLPEGVSRSRLWQAVNHSPLWQLANRGPWQRVLAGGLLAAALLSGGYLIVRALSGPSAAPEPSPTPAAALAPTTTRILLPTLPRPTPTTTVAPTDMPTSTAEPITPTPSFVWVSIAQNARCRSGPGRGFPTVSFLAVGEIVRAYGQDPDGEWWWVELPDGSAFCWVSSGIVGQPVPPPSGEAGVTTSPPERTGTPTTQP